MNGQTATQPASHPSSALIILTKKRKKKAKKRMAMWLLLLLKTLHACRVTSPSVVVYSFLFFSFVPKRRGRAGQQPEPQRATSQW